MPDLPILYRDEHVAVFAKPSGLLVHRGYGNDDIVAVELARDAIGARVYPVHRLDRATSGALLFALDAKTAASLGESFAAGRVEKIYLAVVRGVAPVSIVVDHPVPKSEDGPRVPAVTELRLRHAGERWSLVEARPKTGRFHQIRRHLKHLSHPIVGDVNYGKGDINRLFRERWGLSRLALHAGLLRFADPESGEFRTVLAPLPEDLRGPFQSLGIPESAWAIEGG